jgi:integrase
MGRYSASSSRNRSRALPAEVPDQLKKPEEHSRDRRLQLENATLYLKDLIVAAVETGMRKGELLSLRWKQIRWLQNEIYLPGRTPKTKKDREIPISKATREVLVRRQRACLQNVPGTDPNRLMELFVFGDEVGQQQKGPENVWETAVLEAHGIKVQRTHGCL